jgi:hypothetical protein
MLRFVLVLLAVILSSSASRAQATAEIDLLRLELERQKWRDEVTLRTRELALKEAEQSTREGELELKRQEQAAARWFNNPLVLAILAATLAAIGNAVVAMINGSMQRRLETAKRDAEMELEATKAESTRILEMIKTGDTEAAAKNLQFLIETGLVAGNGRAERLSQFLDNRKPGTGPSLPAPGSRFGFERTGVLTESIESDVRRNLEGYVSYLDQIGFPKDARKANIKIYEMDDPNAHYLNGTLEIDVRYAKDPFAALREFGHHVLTAPGGTQVWTQTQHTVPIESGLADYFAGSFLDNPRVGEVIARIERFEKPYIRIMDNDRKYTEAAKLPSRDRYHDEGEIWSGAFWEIRAHLGKSEADPILAQAWLAEAARDKQPSAASFVRALLDAAAGTKDPARNVETVRAVLRRRKFPLPKTAATA